jgi:TRAP-type C4-dicarboxylate transport system permease large subunit
MFILMAFFSSGAGLADDLYTASSNWLSHIRGGLAIATVFACGIFGAMSGASTASASVMSKIAMPSMRRFGYSEELAAGAIGVGATLDILIPPSVAMVIYGVATQTSIGKLLIAGVIPGMILCIFFNHKLCSSKAFNGTPSSSKCTSTVGSITIHFPYSLDQTSVTK